MCVCVCVPSADLLSLMLSNLVTHPAHTHPFAITTTSTIPLSEPRCSCACTYVRMCTLIRFAGLQMLHDFHMTEHKPYNGPV